MSLIPFIKFPNDSGPIYLETVQGRFPVEPFNTFSNLIFIVLVVYWGMKVYKNPKEHLFLAWVLPIIAFSWVGGTMFHATRSHEFWLRLDWMPIMFLCLTLVLYFVYKITSSWLSRILLVIIFLGMYMGLRTLPIPNGLRISLGYVITALTVLLPLLWYLYKTAWKNGILVVLTFLIFGLAVYFRTVDLTQSILPMGTHWLWHFLGGVAVHFLIAYIFKDNLLNLSANTAVKDD
ncbi:ceramidase [Flagellimonas myxillae]|uniref:ceramidase n=1 Tax=Flagellimonas myxillae TaxID=2942214 RepID=UPI00201F37BC|nr:ceramidase [Muricauda myxillae]MCL6267366.1 ceramidase [Muricauda myxillae]